jgi:hypothetical protein
MMRGISAVTHPELVKEKLDRPWIRFELYKALKEHDGMRRSPPLARARLHWPFYAYNLTQRDLSHNCDHG